MLYGPNFDIFALLRKFEIGGIIVKNHGFALFRKFEISLKIGKIHWLTLLRFGEIFPIQKLSQILV